MPQYRVIRVRENPYSGKIYTVQFKQEVNYLLLRYFRSINVLSDIILYFLTATRLPPPFNRNFGNSLDQCLNPIEHPPNFCTSQNVPADAPTSFERYRTINGTCNNLEPGKATFGAAGIVAARFLPKSMVN